MLQVVLAFLAAHIDVVLLAATPAVLIASVLLFAKLSRPQQDTLLGAVQGAYGVLAAVAPLTQFTWDDALARLLRRVELELGRKLKPKERARAEGIAAALLADPSEPDILAGDKKTNALLEHVARSAA